MATTATLKYKHDVFDGEVAIRPRAFVISGSGEYVDVPPVLPPGTEPIGWQGSQPDYYRYVATSSNDPFLPAIGGRTLVNSSYEYYAGDSRTSAPGINPHSYRRIPFVHKVGGSNMIAAPGKGSDHQIIEEIFRVNFPGKLNNGKQAWLQPHSGITLQFVAFPFGRSAPSEGETTSFQAADNFVHALGNLSSTIYYRQHYTWHPMTPHGSFGTYRIWSGSGDTSATAEYTEISRNDREWRHSGIILPIGPDIIFNNSVASFNPLGANSSLPTTLSSTNDPSDTDGFSQYSGFAPAVTAEGGPEDGGGFGGIDPLLSEVYPIGHPHAGKAKYYELSTVNPATGNSNGTGPINYQGENYWPVNRWVGTNTKKDPSTPLCPIMPIYKHGHQGDIKPYDSMFHLYSKTRARGLMVKGLIEIY